MEIPKGKSLAFYRELCLGSLWAFVKIVGGSAGQGGIINEEIHLPLCRFWQDASLKRKAIFMPRGWLKSTVFTMWGAIWLYLHNPNVKILILSQNALMAGRFLNFIQKQLLRNKLLRALFPELQAITRAWTTSNRWSSTYCDLPRTIETKDASLTSIGIGGAAQSGHYDYIFIDDPCGQKHLSSVVEMQKIFVYHDNVNELLVNPNYMSADGSQVIIVCTFWGPGDYGSYVRENYKEYRWMVVPALKDESLEDEPDLTWLQSPTANHMESNWVNPPDERYTTAYYTAMMNNPEQDHVFWAQHMNHPHRAEGLTKFNKKWLRYYHIEERQSEGGQMAKYIVCEKDDGTDGDAFPLNSISLYGMIDPGGFSDIKRSKGSSRNVLLIGGQPRSSVKKFVLYTYAGKLKKPSEFMTLLFAANTAWKPRIWRIDTIGPGQYMYKDILEARTERKDATLKIGPLPVNTSRDVKDEDIQALMNPMANGEIYIHRSMLELIGEIVQYPGGMTKDLVDMLGKLFKIYWHRRAIAPDGQVQRPKEHDPYYDRNEFTGY